MLTNVCLLIKELRTAKGLTQGRLAEGICSRDTIAKIEAGKRRPDWYTFRSIMYKLGVDPTLYYKDMASEDDAYVQKTSVECDKLLSMRDTEALKLKFNEIEQDKRFKKGAGYRFYLHLKAFLYRAEKNYEANLECLLERARIYRPDFEICKIPEYFLTIEEINNINSMAITYSYLEDGGIEKAIEILEMLEIVLEKDYTLISHDERMSRQLFLNKRNLCSNYKKLGRHEDCINTANKAISRYNGAYHTHEYIYLLYQKAFSLMKLGNKSEGEILYRQFFMCNYVFDKFAYNDIDYKAEFEKEFGYKLDLYIEW